MNNAAKIVAEALTGDGLKKITLGGRSYSVTAPTIYTISRMIAALSRVELPEKVSLADVLTTLPGNSKQIVRALAIAIAGHRFGAPLRARLLRRSLAREATPKELNQSFQTVLTLVQGQDFFECATLAVELTKVAAKPKSPETTR